MRALNFLWFWTVCWNDEKQWTFLFSLMIPLAGFFFTMELARLLMDKKVSGFNTVLLMLITVFINETLLKPISYKAVMSDSCEDGLLVPATAISVSICGALIHLLRFVFTIKDLPFLLGWLITLILEMIAYPVLKYVTTGYMFVSLVPGIIITILFWYLAEFRPQGNTALSLYQVLHLKNDIQPGNERAQDLLPE
ncbi:hypothetical protein TVAG_478150 [Trichomonas vaginalis G3]|uniref:Uncharacterized protein n=1 Tax=Trichomonas vaginalis (strain ATCC PRA-98 / G3) TaxID=412133 RepID=A2FZV9_TRIV3|nr:hypothetical protein TVAG_478150 [Trichomonas vaginalis G3]|eukprot:XP_001302488.1 hypothetical protein [Trichomonas vaginalis G3]